MEVEETQLATRKEIENLRLEILKQSTDASTFNEQMAQVFGQTINIEERLI